MSGQLKSTPVRELRADEVGTPWELSGGSQPPYARTGLTPEQWAALRQAERDPALRWVVPVGAALGLLLSLAGHFGWLPW